MLGQAKGLLDQAEEPVGVADQVVSLPLGDRPARAGLGGRPLGRSGGEEAAHSVSSGATSASSTQAFFWGPARARRRRLGAGRQQRGGRPQRGDVGEGVALRHLVLVIASRSESADRSR